MVIGTFILDGGLKIDERRVQSIELVEIYPKLRLVSLSEQNF